MKKKSAITALVALLATGLAIVFWQWNPKPGKGDGPDLQDMLSSPKTAVQMHLYSANRDGAGKSASGKSLGFDYYKNGGRDIYHVHNDFENGASEDLYLRPDGSLESKKQYYTRKQGEDFALLRSKATYAKDGKTFTSHDVYTEQGKRERSGLLLPSGLYQQTYYCADGYVPERIRYFDANKNFQSERLYDCQSNVLIAEIFPGQYGSQSKIKLVRPDGSIYADLVKDSSGLSGSVFAEDGRTVLVEFKSDYWSQSMRVFDGPDKLSQVWSGSYGRIRVNVYNPITGKRLYLQEWKERDSGAGKQLLLVKVTEFGASDDSSWTREIEMTNDGKVPLTVARPLPRDVELKTLTLPTLAPGAKPLEDLRGQLRLVDTLDSSGKLIKTELVIENQSWNNTLQPQAAAPATVNIDAGLLKLPARPELPSFDKLGPERVYDYEGSTPPSTPVYSGPHDYWP